MSNRNVNPIKIKLTTNIDKEPFELKYSNIYDPAPGIIPRRINISEYPYFTADVKYDEKLLASKKYSKLISTFFDKQEFVKVILKDSAPAIAETLTETKKMENANANIITMLKLMFPTSYPIKNNINTSYKKYLLKQGPSITFDVSDVKSMFSSGEITALDKHNYSYLKTNSGISTVSEIIWVNDLLNNKLYRELIDKLIEYNEWREKQTAVIVADIQKTTDKLQNGLTPLSKTGPGTGELIIDEVAQNDLASQKRIYNPDDIKADIIKIIEKYLKIDSDTEKTRIFNEELGLMLDYFIDNYIKNAKETPITQLVRFKDKFDFTYKIQDEDKDLFTLHKRYNGEDREREREKLLNIKEAKQKEYDDLNGVYIKNNKLIFGKSGIDTYIKALKQLQKSSTSEFAIPDNINPKKTNEDLEKILKENIPSLNTNYDNIILFPNKEYTKEQFFNVINNSVKKTIAFNNSITRRIDEISSDELINMVEKLGSEKQKLN